MSEARTTTPIVPSHAPLSLCGGEGQGEEVWNALTVDFEDWYQGLEIPVSEWGVFEDRIERAGERLLGVLAEARVRATFFVLGHVAERHPDLVRRIQTSGHEIGTHGHSHTFIYTQTPDVFREEMTRAVGTLRDETAAPVVGHRAPFFSITKRSLWALDILRDLGLRYDSSIFPVHNYRYGIADAPRWPYRLEGPGAGLHEFPITTWQVLGQNLPVAGGAYFRIYPYLFTRLALRRINASGHPVAFYLHPWELDPDHPRIPLPRRIAATHYFNLKAMEARLRRLLRDFRFAPMGEVLGVS
jgi:polysaccharide deacetylase family protein (PEP-CTERM system associated)